MIAVLTTFHVLICFGLIIVVLLQTGKGTGMASVFGGGGGGALMGGKGFGGVLAKATAALAILFMVTSITLSLLPRGGGQRSVLGDREMAPPAETPVGEAAPPQTPSQEVPGEMPEGGPVETPPVEEPGQLPGGE
jgi:preprotein translocase subunit SecG